MQINGTPAQLDAVYTALRDRNSVLVSTIRERRRANDEAGVQKAKAERTAVFDAMEAVENTQRQQRIAGEKVTELLGWTSHGVAIEADDKAAEARGFASFNDNPHLLVNVPNGAFTISARTADGRRITFAFIGYEVGGAPQCVDVQYHDSGRTQANGDKKLPSFHVIGFRPGRDGDAFDTRKDKEPTLITVLMDEQYRAAQADQGAAA